MATRGYLGGLAQATGDTALLLDAAGKQMILVETVGVGQGEIQIVRLADCTIVVLVPGMGDDVQSLKAGLMEIGDIFVINKSRSRRRGPLRAATSRRAGIVPEREGWKPPIVRTIATERKASTTWRTRLSFSARISIRRTSGAPAKWSIGRNGCCDCWRPADGTSGGRAHE